MTKKTTLVILALFIVVIPFLVFSWTQTFSRGQTRIFVTDKFQIQAMTMDEQGRVWACYDVRNHDGYYVGVFQMDKLLATYKQSKSGNDVTCRHILVDRKGNVWVNYDDNELWIFDGKSWKIMPGIGADIIAIDNSGKIWVASNNSLNVFDGKSWTVFQENTSPLSDKKEDQITAVAFDNKDQMWVGTHNGFYIVDGQNWEFHDTQSNMIVSIAFDKQGKAWFGHEFGISTFDGNNWIYRQMPFNGDVGIYVNYISSGISDDTGAFLDKSGNAWFTFYGFISVFDGKEWRYYLGGSGDLGLVDQDSRIWFSGNRFGFLVLSSEKIRLASEPTAVLFIFLTTGGVWFFVTMLVCIWLAYAFNSWKGIGLGFSVGALIVAFSLWKTLSQYNSWSIFNRVPFVSFDIGNFSGLGFVLIVSGVIGGLIGKIKSRPEKPNQEIKAAFQGWVVGLIIYFCYYLLSSLFAAMD